MSRLVSLRTSDFTSSLLVRRLRVHWLRSHDNDRASLGI
jgi:hypothetical protein